jgi:hypothetical protein
MAYAELQATGTAGAAGTLTLTVKAQSRQRWTITQVSIECEDAPGGAECNLRKNGYLITPMVPNSDAAGGDPPIKIAGNDRLTIEWTGLDVGNVGQVLVIYDDGQGPGP